MRMNKLRFQLNNLGVHWWSEEGYTLFSAVEGYSQRTEVASSSFNPFSDIQSLVSPAADTVKMLLGNMVTGEKNLQKH